MNRIEFLSYLYTFWPEPPTLSFQTASQKSYVYTCFFLFFLYIHIHIHIVNSYSPDMDLISTELYRLLDDLQAYGPTLSKLE